MPTKAKSFFLCLWAFCVWALLVLILLSFYTRGLRNDLESGGRLLFGQNNIWSNGLDEKYFKFTKTQNVEEKASIKKLIAKDFVDYFW